MTQPTQVGETKTMNADTKPKLDMAAEEKALKRAEEELAASRRLGDAAVAYTSAKRDVVASDAGGLDPDAVTGWRKALLELDAACRAFAKFNRILGDR